MGEKTGISWTDSTWNPVRGCSKVSAGCKNCYAETFAERWRGVPGHAFEQGFDLRLVPEALQLPLRWKRPRRIFVNSMSDLFHEDVPESFIREVFWTMSRVPRHTFQVLTKRPARMRSILAGWKRDGLTLREGWGSVLQNVWLGVSVEDQRAADERIPELLATPAAVRFLSCEPLLGEVDLRPTIDAWTRQVASAAVEGRQLRPLPPRIDWVIVGGESGPGARPMDLAWARQIVGQCQSFGLRCFVKQLGAMPATAIEVTAKHRTDPATGRRQMGMLVTRLPLRDRAGRDPTEWPADLRVQQFPEVTRG